MTSGVVVEGRCGGQSRCRAGGQGAGAWSGVQRRGRVGGRAAAARGWLWVPVDAARGGSKQAGAVPGEARGLLLPTAWSRHPGAAENREQGSRAGWSRSQ